MEKGNCRKVSVYAITKPVFKIFNKQQDYPMSKLLTGILCISMMAATLKAEQDIQIMADQTDELYRPAAASQDGAFTSLSLSMLGWGVGVAAGVAILASVLHQSSSAHDSGSGCNAHNH